MDNNHHRPLTKVSKEGKANITRKHGRAGIQRGRRLEHTVRTTQERAMEYTPQIQYTLHKQEPGRAEHSKCAGTDVERVLDTMIAHLGHSRGGDENVVWFHVTVANPTTVACESESEGEGGGRLAQHRER